MYQDIYECICQNKKIRYIVHYIKPTVQVLFKIRFPKGGPTCRRQVVNRPHQTPQGQSPFSSKLSVFAVGPQYQHRYFFFIYIKKNIIWVTQHFKKIHVSLKPEWDLQGKYWMEASFIQGFLQLSLWCILGSNLCKHGHSVTAEARTSLVRVCVVWMSGRLSELSALWLNSTLLSTFPHRYKLLSIKCSQNKLSQC